MAGNEPVYEMLWDCGYCDAKKNLGVTHRFCPNCGSPQDPTRRYFPPESEKIAVQDHTFVGVDKMCPACSSPMSAKAEFCGVCGSPMDAAKAAKLVAEGESVRERKFVGDAPKTPPPEPPKEGMSALAKGAILFFVAAIVCCGLFTFWTKEGSVTVTELTWTRTIEVEEFKTVKDGAWKESTPNNARFPRCYEKKQSTEQVPDGQECKTVKVDQGDGTYKEKQDCKAKTKSVDKMGTWCDYEIDKWASKNTEKATGNGNKPEPTWPAVNVTGCQSLGCTREGTKTETYTLGLTVEGEATTCDVPRALWDASSPGKAYTAQIRMMGGGVDCGTLKAE